MKFRQPYDENYKSSDFATDVGYDPTQPNADLEASLTEQSFKEECDINNIVRQYERTGLMPHQRPNQPIFADISDAPSFLEAQNVVAAANEAFAAIPAEIRERFMNDPARLMAFLDDDKIMTKPNVSASFLKNLLRRLNRALKPWRKPRKRRLRRNWPYSGPDAGCGRLIHQAPAPQSWGACG